MTRREFKLLGHCARIAITALAAAAISEIISCGNPADTWLEPPSFVKAELVDDRFEVSWDKPGEGLSYEVLRKDGVGEYSVVSGAPVERTSYTDASFPDDTALIYAVRSVSGDRCSYPSKPSNQVSRYILDLGASRLEYPDRIVVTWAPYEGASGYVVYRSNPAFPAPVIVGTSQSCEWIDTTASSDTPYFYRVSWIEGSKEKGTGGPSALGVFTRVKDYYEPNDDYADIESQSVTSVFEPGFPPVIYSFGDNAGNIYADPDWYEYAGPSLPVKVTVTIPADSSFLDGELLFSFFLGRIEYPQAPLARGNNIRLFTDFGSQTGNVSLAFRIVPSVASSRSVIGTYNVRVSNEL